MSDRLLPINATTAELATEQATARVGDVPVLARGMQDPDECPPALLPWLAWAFSVDDWDPTWSTNQKRQTIAKSAAVHQHKGTIGAVRNAIAALGIEAQVQEWFAQLPAGAPYTFRLLLDADQTGIPLEMLNKLLDIVNSTKNLRSHLDTVVPGATAHSKVFLAGVPGVGSEITVEFNGWNLVSNGAAASDGQFSSNGLDLT